MVLKKHAFRYLCTFSSSLFTFYSIGYLKHELCLSPQHAARYLANQDWVKIDSLKTVENTAVLFSSFFIPLITGVIFIPSSVP